ncbi:hypothetical protein I546_0043 [Mycobacterium kansasii 732]|nr:hypothetical protein I546_0043 [Mycobacterium kansasii 732]
MGPGVCGAVSQARPHPRQRTQYCAVTAGDERTLNEEVKPPIL